MPPRAKRTPAQPRPARKKRPSLQQQRQAANGEVWGELLVKYPDLRNTAANHSRQLQDEKAAEEAKAKRFNGILMRGVKVGETTMDKEEFKIVDSRNRTRTIKEIKGRALVYLTIDHNGAFSYRVWPAGWKAPGQVHKSHMTSFAGIGRLAAEDQVRDRVQQAKAFDVAQSLSTDQQGGITKNEAELITKYDDCYKVGLSHLRAYGRLPVPDGIENTYNKDDVQQGQDFFKQLQDAYPRLFPDRATAAIAAAWYLSREEDLPSWLSHPTNNDGATDDEQGTNYLDAYVLHFHRTIYVTASRDPKKRNTIDNLAEPMHCTDMPKDEIKELHDLGMNKCIIQGLNEMQLLQNSSRIAIEALKGKLITDYEWQENAEKTLPMLGPSQERPSRLPNHVEWHDEFYNGAKFVPVEPDSGIPENVLPIEARRDADAVQALFDIQNNMTNHSDNILVQMVWRDFLLPFADEGNVSAVRRYGRMLELMVANRTVAEWRDEGHAWPMYDLDEDEDAVYEEQEWQDMNQAVHAGGSVTTITNDTATSRDLSPDLNTPETASRQAPADSGTLTAGQSFPSLQKHSSGSSEGQRVGHVEEGRKHADEEEPHRLAASAPIKQGATTSRPDRTRRIFDAEDVSDDEA